jgi:GNAT superfamily N-acetyltransferase
MIDVRGFLDSDFDAIVPAWHETNLATYTYVRAHQEHSLDDARRFFRDVLLKECRVWVAQRASRAAGVMATQGEWIRQFAVFPPFQRQGIGTALLAKARALSPRRLRLYTFQRNNAARAFYERHGFAAVAFGISPAPESEPDVEYLWQADTDAER